jgi:hypothetical protein
MKRMRRSHTILWYNPHCFKVLKGASPSVKRETGEGVLTLCLCCPRNGKQVRICQ